MLHLQKRQNYIRLDPTNNAKLEHSITWLKTHNLNNKTKDRIIF